MSDNLSLTPEMLKDLIATAVTAAVSEAKKPAPPTAKELAQIQQDQENRLANGQSELEKQKNKRAAQLICTHEHSRRDGGQTHCVHVREENPLSPGYVLCQKCQGRVRPDSADKLDHGAIYDTVLFNTLFQSCFDGGAIQ